MKSPPCPPAIQILVSEIQSEWRYSFSNRTLFWPEDTIISILALLYQDEKESINFLRSKKVEKYENMTSYNRLYVLSTDILMSQRKKLGF